MDVLADVDALPSWSAIHKRAEIIDIYPDGRPHHVRVTIKVVGVTDKEMLEYHWGPDWVVWDAQKTFHQHAQHVEFNLTPDIDGTRVRFDVTKRIWLFSEFRYLNTQLTDYTFGSTVYPNHIATTDWNVHIGSINRYLAVGGLGFSF